MMDRDENRQMVQVAGLDLLAISLSKSVDEILTQAPLEALSCADTKLLAELFRIRLDWWQGNLTQLQAREQLRDTLRHALVCVLVARPNSNLGRAIRIQIAQADFCPGASESCRPVRLARL